MRAQLNLKCPFISIFSCSEDAGIPYCGNETTPRHWQYIDGFTYFFFKGRVGVTKWSVGSGLKDDRGMESSRTSSRVRQRGERWVV